MSQTKKQAHFNLFLYGSGHHQAAWRAENSGAERLQDLDYYIELAQLCERGLLDAVFFADGQAVNPQAAAAGPTWFFEPLTLLTALSQHTTHLGLVCTVSSSFYTPFHAARLLASLDRISGGRAGANIVTSMWDTEAQNHGMDKLGSHEQRYGRAEEFITVLKSLWDSFPASAVKVDKAGRFTDPERLRTIDHAGEHFKVRGPLNLPHGPQGTPVLFQAGASEQGRNLAAKHAEAIYAVAADEQMALEYSQDVRERVSAAGRDSQGLAIMPGLVAFVGKTLEQAKAKQRALNDLLPIEQSLEQLALFVQQDVKSWDLDAPVPQLPPAEEFTGPAGRYATILRLIQIHQPTVRELLGLLAAGGGHCTMVGTPEMIADEIERWLDSGAADGFNLMPPSLPGSLEDFIELVIPELQRRGRYRTEYEYSTLRENLGLPALKAQELEPALTGG